MQNIVNYTSNKKYYRCGKGEKIMNLNDILQDLVNEPYESLLNMAKVALSNVLPVFKESIGEENAVKCAVAIFATCIGVDGELTELEIKFIKDIYNNTITESDIKGLVVNYRNDEGIQLVNNLVDSCSHSLKSQLLILCGCFLAVDERFTSQEIAFMHLLAAQE